MFEAERVSEPNDEPILLLDLTRGGGSNHPGSVHMISRSYGGQMTRAMKNMLLHQCWAGSFASNVHVVEPFSAKSSLYHSQSIWHEVESGGVTSAARLSDYFDMGAFNKLSKEHYYASIMRWEDFLRHAPSSIVAVAAPETVSCEGRKLLSQSNASSAILVGPYEELAETCTLSSQYRNFLAGLQKYNFTATTLVCIQCSSWNAPIELSEIRDAVYKYANRSENLTLTFSMWRNYASVGLLRMPEHCKHSDRLAGQVVSSHNLMNQSQYYIQHFVKSTPYISVMIRVERFLTQKNSGRMNESFTSCLNRAIEKYELHRKNRAIPGVFVTLDIGKFGSGELQGTSKQLSRRKFGREGWSVAVDTAFKHFFSERWTFSEWESSFVEASGGIEERGYIALLQRTIAISGDCLILFGGGKFQEVALQQFKAAYAGTSKLCLEAVCTEKTIADQV